MESLTKELRLVLRRLARNPLFSLVTVVTLAVGIGANSAIFSIVNGVLLKPLPFPDSERLVGVWHAAPGMGFEEVNQGPAFHLTYREENRVFEDIGMWDNTSQSVTGLAEPEEVEGLRVTEAIIPILGVKPAIGRSFTAEDDTPGSPETVILTYPYWQRRFGGDTGVVGRPMTIDGRLHTVIGVMPEEFRFLRYHPAVILPYRLNRADVFVGNFSHQALARLKPGVTLEQANGDVARMIPLVLERFPLPPGLTHEMLSKARFEPNLRPLKQDAVGDTGKVLWVLLGTAGIVLLIACANVANLFLVRAEGRQREFALRTAMGAGRRQVAQELLNESVALGLVGGILGLGVAFAGIRLLVALGPDSIPRLEEIAIDTNVLLFTLAISVLAGVLFGSIAVFRSAGQSLASVLNEASRTGSEGKARLKARHALVVSQIALALVLLVCSGLMIRSFQALLKVEPGFVRPEDVLTLRISIPASVAQDGERAVRMHEQILRRIEQLPGVESVGLSSSITMDGLDSNDPIFVEDFPDPGGQVPPIRRFKWISENYFSTMGNSILFGRDITWTDISNKRPVVIVTENLAHEYWKDAAKAVGKRIRETPKSPWREIVGVVGNEHDNGMHQAPTPTVYWPMMVADYWGQSLFARRTMGYAVRSPRAGSAGFLKEVQQAVWATSSSLPLANVRTLEDIVESSMARTSFTLIMLGIAAGVALLLGSVGIYGVISYAVSRRTREIGIRIALGAGQEQVCGMFVRQALLLIGAGVLIGLGAALGLTRLMSALLFGVSHVDGVTFSAVSLGLAIIALLAAYLPARRASKVDPAEALRCE